MERERENTDANRKGLLQHFSDSDHTKLPVGGIDTVRDEAHGRIMMAPRPAASTEALESRTCQGR